jgi:hypothetical protein
VAGVCGVGAASAVAMDRRRVGRMCIVMMVETLLVRIETSL